MNDVVVGKIASMQRCVKRAREEYRSDPAGFDTNYTVQDAAVLNVVRACEQAIDLANHVIRMHKMGIPANSGESFDLLRDRSVISPELAGKLKKMIHFRNIVIHQYQHIDLEIVKAVIVTGLDDLIEFGDRVSEL
jgi:uncharacterized protein YutE (UPF0331/DUF86 family)